MNTFICWSQARSKQIAGVLREWLPHVLPGENFFLSSDIEKGTLWFEAIRTQLQGADAAIICLTPENIDSPWMHFEVGAIAGKNAESRIFAYLFGLTPSEVSGPLAAFQSSSCTKEDTRKLVLALEKVCQKPIEKFDEHWPDLEAALADVAPNPRPRPGARIRRLPEFQNLPGAAPGLFRSELAGPLCPARPSA